MGISQGRSTGSGCSRTADPPEESSCLSSYLAGATALPAWHLAHGDSDCNVPDGQSAELDAALKKAGATQTYVLLKGAGHADGAFDQTQLQPTITFLTQSLAP